MKSIQTAVGTLMLALLPLNAAAQTLSLTGSNECPVGLVKGLSLDDEFGPGTQQLTRCLQKRAQVKMVVQINQFKTSTGAAYGLGNIGNIIDDYEITHGMVRGRDYEIAVVLHGPGGMMALKDTSYTGGASPTLVSGRNPFEGQVRGLMAKGVKFYFCQNTTRAYLSNGTLPKYQATGISATAQLIEGMQYTTAGLTSIADFEAAGYAYIQP
jgi:intracellular sulfur oxidation DsrE/DsrF family protein